MMKSSKKLAAAALAAVLTFGTGAVAWAHDGWSQTNAPIIAQGQISYVDMLFGNHSNDHKSYRIAGQWSTDSSNVYVTTPAGQKVDITATRFYTGEAATETEPALNNGFVATFSSSSPGAYIVSVEGDSVFNHGGVSSRTLRSAKSFVAVSDIPILDRVQALTGFAQSVSMDRAELVPLFNPAAATPGRQASVQLLLKGEPLADTEVSLIRRSTSESESYRTNEDGIVTFTTGKADYYLLRAKPATDESKDGEYSSISYEATMTFAVQNAPVKLSAAAAPAVPHIYVNGKPVEAPGTELRNGSTYVTKAFIQRYLDASYSAEAAPVREIGERTGATIEYLPAVGEARAAVLIYTRTQTP